MVATSESILPSMVGLRIRAWGKVLPEDMEEYAFREVLSY